MAEQKSKMRITGSIPGRLAGWLLALLWVFSMSGVDSHSFSAYPACVVLVVVLLTAGVGVLHGYRVVRMSWTGWLTLAIAAYFLLRCLNSYALVDSWEDEAIILGAVVFYVAGVYVAQKHSYSSVFRVLAVALVLNGVVFFVARQPWFCIEWTGRAQYTPEGENSVPTSLFIYKNFAGFFFVAGGLALAAWAAWMLRGVRKGVALLVAISAIVLSFYCNTRVPYFILPVGLLGVWGLDVLQHVYSGRKIGWFSYVAGFIFLGCLIVAVCDLFQGNYIGAFLSNTESHLRYRIWSSVCEVLPNAGIWGCGAGATEWEIIPYYNEWALPNYAHNDYLQLWLDYGLAGLLLAVVLLVIHVVQGVRCMSSELVSNYRRSGVAAALVIVLVLVVYAMADFPWHSFALVCMGAFCCGVLASPFPRLREGWSRNSGDSGKILVRAETIPGKCILVLVMLALAGCCVQLGGNLREAWLAQWEYNKLSKGNDDPYALKRRAVIAGLMPHYPASAVMDTYFMLPPYGMNVEEQEKLIRMAHRANPRQLFISLMLTDVLDRMERFEEAERVFRQTYVGDAMRNTMLARWPSYYAHHLLLWGKFEMKNGRQARALSMLDYAMKMHKKYSIHFRMPYRYGDQPWLEHGGMKPYLPRLIEGARADVRLMKMFGIQPDDGWKDPLEPGSRGALYRSVIEKNALK